MITSSLSWKGAWGIASYRLQFFVTCAVLVVLAISFRSFFDFIESRSGPVLNDWLLPLLPAADVSWGVFFFEYSAVLLGIISMARQPVNFLAGIQTYILVTLMRMITITLFPLNPPYDYIPMREPLVQFISTDSRIISRDLFFSGHVSTICSVLFVVTARWHQYFIGFCVVAVSVLLLVQRNHYTIDVAAAPVLTYLCYWVTKRYIAGFS